MNRVLTSNEVRELQGLLFMLADKYGGRVDPRALNALYSNEDDIPEEFR